MANAPYQLWMDLAPISSVIAVSGTATVTTQSAHGITPGAYVQLSGLTAAGTTMNGVAAVATVPSSTTFTYVLTGASGTATTTAGVISYDLMNPPINYASGTARQNAMVVDLESLNLSANGDGSGSSMNFTILQEITPAVGPWFNLIPDNTRLRFYEVATGSTPGTADIRFLGYLQGLNSAMNGSGQGCVTQVNCSDVTTLLDNLGVFGKAITPVQIRSAVRLTNSVTITTIKNSGYLVGQQIRVSGCAGGGTASFNGLFTVAGTGTKTTGSQTQYTFNYSQTGQNATMNEKLGGGYLSVSASRVGTAKDRFRLTGTGNSQLNIESGASVGVFGITCVPGSGWSNAGLAQSYLNNDFSGDQVVNVGGTAVDIIMPSPIAAWGTFTGGNIIVQGAQAGDPVTNGQITVTIASGATETNAVTRFLSTVHAYKGGDPALQRLFTTNDTSKIVGGTAYVAPQEVQFSATTLRSALDAIVENYTGAGQDTRARRYFVDVNGLLNYALTDASSAPTFANAPYSITTASAGSPNTSTSKATVAPYSLNANWDHQMYKTAMFTLPSTSGSVIAQVYDYDGLPGKTTAGSALYTTRVGAPYLDSIVEFPTAVKNPGAQIAKAAAAWFSERSRPMLSGQLEVRGAGTAAWNSLGFSAGYAQSAFTLATANRTASTVTITTSSAHLLATANTVVISGITGAAGTSMNGTATITVTSGTAFTYTSTGTAGAGTITSATGYGYRLVSGWSPGQFVEVASTPLGLSGLYRVEQVNWSLEPGGTYLQRIQILFNRKNPNDLAQLIAGAR